MFLINGELIELIPALEKVMKATTKHYQGDFQYDIVRLKEAMREQEPERRTLYWMARPSGTWMTLERDLFLQGTDGNRIFTHYADQVRGVEVYRVEVEPGYGDKPMGRAHRLNYPALLASVREKALPAAKVELTFADGQAREVAADRYYSEREWLFQEYGMAQHIRFCPDSEERLALVLQEEHKRQAKSRPRAIKTKPRNRGR